LKRLEKQVSRIIGFDEQEVISNAQLDFALADGSVDVNIVFFRKLSYQTNYLQK